MLELDVHWKGDISIRVDHRRKSIKNGQRISHLADRTDHIFVSDAIDPIIRWRRVRITQINVKLKFEDPIVSYRPANSIDRHITLWPGINWAKGYCPVVEGAEQILNKLCVVLHVRALFADGMNDIKKDRHISFG